MAVAPDALFVAAVCICCLQSRVNAYCSRLCSCEETLMACESVRLAYVPACRDCTEVVVRRNKLRVLEIMNMPHLRNLTVSHNPISSWDLFDIGKLSNLTHLFLASMNLSLSTNITDSAGVISESLQVFHVTNCFLRSLERAFTPFPDNFPSLHWLSLRGNNLETFPQWYLNEILFVDLRDNWIKNLDFNTFSIALMPFANSVDLSGNPIRYVDERMVPDQLASIRLERTRISDFDFAAWSHWKRNDTRRLHVHLHGTLLACSCHQARGLLEMHAADNDSKLVLQRGSEPCGVVGDCSSCGFQWKEPAFNGGHDGLRKFLTTSEAKDDCRALTYDHLQPVLTPRPEVATTAETTTGSWSSGALVGILLLLIFLGVGGYMFAKKEKLKKKRELIRKENERRAKKINREKKMAAAKEAAKEAAKGKMAAKAATKAATKTATKTAAKAATKAGAMTKGNVDQRLSRVQKRRAPRK